MFYPREGYVCAFAFCHFCSPSPSLSFIFIFIFGPLAWQAWRLLERIDCTCAFVLCIAYGEGEKKETS